jgi:hypothetical protein
VSAEPTCNSGVEALGRIPWGSHFCNFYNAASDLAECVVPFFRQGLADHEMGIWITSDPMDAGEARRRLAAVQPDLTEREARGQIQILDFADWYFDASGSITTRALRTCLERLAAAQQRGFAGVRMSGNSFWLERKYWSMFTDYEKQLHAAVHDSRIVVLCSYSLQRCTAHDILEIVKHHDFALVRAAQGWQRMDNSALGAARA